MVIKILHLPQIEYCRKCYVYTVSGHRKSGWCYLLDVYTLYERQLPTNISNVFRNSPQYIRFTGHFHHTPVIATPFRRRGGNLR